MEVSKRVGSRSRKLRTKTGCVTCRIRRVKCDEKKPACNRCTSTGRTCDGYDPQFVAPKPRESSSKRSSGSPSRQGLALARRIIAFSFDDERQGQTFDFFISCTVPGSSTFVGADFWASRVVQLSHAEPAIRYALCSLSSLHRMQATSHGKLISADGMAEYKQYSLQQYAKAVSLTKKLIDDCAHGGEEAIVKALVACVLFICYENLVGNYSVAQMHLQNGLRIVSDAETSSPGPIQRPIPVDIARVLLRLDLQAMAFSDTRAPYPYDTTSKEVQLPRIDRFEDYAHATNVLFEIFKWVFRLAAISEPMPVDQKQLDQGKDATHSWLVNFELLSSSDQAPPYKDIDILLRMYLIGITTMLETRIYGDEMIHDNYLHHHQEIVSLGHSYLVLREKAFANPINRSFSLEIGMIFPLYYVVSKCRDPVIRRGALDLLRTSGFQEGALPSTGAADVGELIMNIEESRVPLAITSADIPESARVYITNIALHTEIRSVSVSCVLFPNGMEAMPEIKSGFVTF